MASEAPVYDDDVVHVINADGTSPIVLVCEHASSFIPAFLNDLGLKEQDRQSHAAWDPGALAVAMHLSKIFDAKLVASKVSRLVYDCNRPPEAADAMPARSERVEVPGNDNLDSAARAERTALFYEPFRQAVSDALNATPNPILITVHSFTPIFDGKPRSVDVGILHDSDSRMADAMLSAAGASNLNVQRNDPYGPQDGVTHTLKEHAITAGHANVMIEIRNDLIADAAGQALIADQLGVWLAAALPAFVPSDSGQEGSLACAG